MNTYNKAVLDTYCREVGYDEEKKRELVDIMLKKYGDRLDTENLLVITEVHNSLEEELGVTEGQYEQVERTRRKVN